LLPAEKEREKRKEKRKKERERMRKKREEGKFRWNRRGIKRKKRRKCLYR